MDPLENIAKLRRIIGMTQAELAKASGVTRNVIQNLEGGRSGATPEVLEKLADLTGVDPACLRGGLLIDQDGAPYTAETWQKWKTAQPDDSDAYQRASPYLRACAEVLKSQKPTPRDIKRLEPLLQSLVDLAGPAEVQRQLLARRPQDRFVRVRLADVAAILPDHGLETNGAGDEILMQLFAVREIPVALTGDQRGQLVLLDPNTGQAITHTIKNELVKRFHKLKPVAHLVQAQDDPEAD